MLTNIKKQPGPSKQNAPMFRLYLADLNDVDVNNWPASVNATITTDILLPSKKWNFIDSTAKSINPSAGPGESPLNGILTLTPVIEGITKESLAWIYANVGNDFIAVWERCSDKQLFIAGSPCSSGLKLSYTNIGTLDGGIGGIALQLQGQECPEPILMYDVVLDIAP